MLEPGTWLTRFFIAWCLLFGETAAVLCFNRVARALQALLVDMRVICTHFFDDFCQLAVTSLAEPARATLKATLAVLGWELSEAEMRSLDNETLGPVGRFSC